MNSNVHPLLPLIPKSNLGAYRRTHGTPPHVCPECWQLAVSIECAVVASSAPFLSPVHSPLVFGKAALARCRALNSMQALATCTSTWKVSSWWRRHVWRQLLRRSYHCCTTARPAIPSYLLTKLKFPRSQTCSLAFFCSPLGSGRSRLRCCLDIQEWLSSANVTDTLLTCNTADAVSEPSACQYYDAAKTHFSEARGPRSQWLTESTWQELQYWQRILLVFLVLEAEKAHEYETMAEHQQNIIRNMCGTDEKK